MGALGTDNEAAAAEPVVRIAPLVSFDFVSGDLHLWNGFYALTVNGITYQPAYGAMEVSGLDFSAAPVANVTTVSTAALEGLNDEIIGSFLNSAGECVGRIMTVRLVFFDENWQPINLPVISSVSTMQPPQITRSSARPGETSTQRISVSGENIFAGRARNRVATYSDTDQKTRSPTDRGCEFIGSLANRVFTWPDY